MQVTIEHREESAGLTGSTKHHYVDCTVGFSEEEKAIIKARALYDHNFVVGSATPISSQVAYVGSGALNSLGRIGVIGGIILGFLSPFIGGASGMIAGWCVFLGAAAWIYAAVVMRRQNKRIADPDQVIKLKDLVNRGNFTVYASSPAGAQDVDEEIRGALSRMASLASALPNTMLSERKGILPTTAILLRRFHVGSKSTLETFEEESHPALTILSPKNVVSASARNPFSNENLRSFPTLIDQPTNNSLAQQRG